MTHAPGAIPGVDAAEAADRLGRADAPKPLLVDVREIDEFRDVRVEGAALLPMSSFAERHAELPKDRPLLVMCAGGTRSAAATAFLLRGGWADVVNVEGGITAWQRQGLPVRRGDLQPGEGDLPG
jgi:rhodanese-related sulfurtransferase